MNLKEDKQTIENAMMKSRYPINVRRLAPKLNLPWRYVQYILSSNKGTFERANPHKVGSGKWNPVRHIENMNGSRSRRLRNLIHLWKLKETTN